MSVWKEKRYELELVHDFHQVVPLSIKTSGDPLKRVMNLIRKENFHGYHFLKLKDWRLSMPSYRYIHLVTAKYV